MDNLSELVETLAKARADIAENKPLMVEMLDAVTRTQEYINLKATYDNAVQVEKNTTAAIQDLGVALYNADGNKQIHPSVSISVTKKFQIDDDAAVMAWCVKNYAAAVVTKVDEKLVKDLALFNVKKNHAQIDGVSVTDALQVRISATL